MSAICRVHGFHKIPKKILKINSRPKKRKVVLIFDMHKLKVSEKLGDSRHFVDYLLAVTMMSVKVLIYFW